MATVHTATIREGGEVFHFAGLDGQTFIEVGRPVAEDEGDALERAMNGDGSQTLPLRMTRSWLRSCGAVFNSVPVQAT